MGATSSINGKEIVALDCEMVLGMDNNHILARVSIVSYEGKLLLDSYVSPREKVRDYLTDISGIRPIDLHGAPSFTNIQRQVREILSNKILVGYSFYLDFKVLELTHPIENTRDIFKSRFLINKYGNSRGQSASLEKLSLLILNRRIQAEEHDSIEDAKAALDIYKHYQKEIEEEAEEHVLVARSIGMEIEPEQESSIGTGTAVVAGIAAVSAIAALSYLTRNNRQNNN